MDPREKIAWVLSIHFDLWYKIGRARARQRGSLGRHDALARSRGGRRRRGRSPSSGREDEGAGAELQGVSGLASLDEGQKVLKELLMRVSPSVSVLRARPNKHVKEEIASQKEDEEGTALNSFRKINGRERVFLEPFVFRLPHFAWIIGVKKMFPSVVTGHSLRFDSAF